MRQSMVVMQLPPPNIDRFQHMVMDDWWLTINQIAQSPVRESVGGTYGIRSKTQQSDQIRCNSDIVKSRSRRFPWKLPNPVWVLVLSFWIRYKGKTSNPICFKEANGRFIYRNGDSLCFWEWKMHWVYSLSLKRLCLHFRVIFQLSGTVMKW